jgi:hypothetical protein
MAEANTQTQAKERPAYTGEGISVKGLEDSIGGARDRQNAKVGELAVLREKNVQLQKTLSDEVRKLRKLSDYVSQGKLRSGFVSNLKEVLSYIPGLRNLGITKRSIEELLRQQYEISSLRVKEAAEFADKLKAAQADLYTEIERLNAKIIEAAKNEEVAAEIVLELKAERDAREAAIKAMTAGAAGTREAQAELDKLRQELGEHSMKLQLYHTAEERLARLKENTHMLGETIGNLYSDITQYVTAASEKLDLVSGQIQAVGTAADASMVMLELKRSLDVMTESMNQTTQFVSETQVYFRQNLDKLVQELELYDTQTQSTMAKNLAISRELEEKRIAEAIAVAQARKTGAPEAAPPAA